MSVSNKNSITPPSCGMTLKKKREELHLSIPDVAKQLNLKDSIIESLEKDSYQEFDCNLYVIGHTRSYARLLKIDENILIENLLKENPHLHQMPDDLHVNRKSKTAEKKSARFVHLIIIFIILGLMIWYHSNFINDLESSISATIPENNKSDTDVNPMKEITPVAEEPATDVTDRADTKNTIDVIETAKTLQDNRYY